MEGSRARAGGTLFSKQGQQARAAGVTGAGQKIQNHLCMVGMVCITQGASIPVGILASGEAGACQFLSFDVPMLVQLIPGGNPRSAVIPSKPYSTEPSAYAVSRANWSRTYWRLSTLGPNRKPNDSSDAKPRSTTPVLSFLSAWLCFRGLQR